MTDFTEPAEYADLRAAIREITLTHGPAEYAEHGRTSTPMSGLWTDLGKAGFIGIAKYHKAPGEKLPDR